MRKQEGMAEVAEAQPTGACALLQFIPDPSGADITSQITHGLVGLDSTLVIKSSPTSKVHKNEHRDVKKHLCTHPVLNMHQVLFLLIKSSHLCYFVHGYKLF